MEYTSEDLRPNDERARIAVTMIYVVLAAEILSLISGYLQYELLMNVAGGGTISEFEATINDTREQAVGLIYLAVFIGSGIAFIRWFRRAYYNMHQMVDYLNHEESWAAGCWFVPILNLYRPYQIMKELYEEASKILIERGKLVVPVGTNNLGWWWGLWVISGLLGQFILRATMSADSVDDYIATTIADMAASMIGIILALLTVKVIRDYAALETPLAEPQSIPDTSSPD